MQLVDVMEADIGCPVEQWPSSILRLLFAYQPHMPNSLTNLHLITAFFFGNNVRLDVACHLFAACTSLPLFHVKPEVTYLCDLWSLPSTRNGCQYYSLEEDRFKYTDGAYTSAFDNVIQDFGFEPTGFPSMISEILLQVNQLECEEDVEE